MDACGDALATSVGEPTDCMVQFADGGSASGDLSDTKPNGSPRVPRVPQRIGLVTFRRPEDAVAPTDPAGLLLNDFSDALVAYARMSSHGSAGAAHPPLLRVNVTTPIGTPNTQPATTDATAGAPGAPAGGRDALAGERDTPPRMPEALGTCDSIVLAYTSGAGTAQDTAYERALDRLIASFLAPGTRVYALIASASSDGCDGESSAAVCQHRCACAGLPWCGGVIATDAALVSCLMRAPRLGMWRHSVSQAIDQLVAAVRMGCSLDEVPQLAQGMHYEQPDEPADAPEDLCAAAHILVASPHPIWRAVARRLSRR